MALFNVVCTKCRHHDQLLAENNTAAMATPCAKCGGSVSRTATGPVARKMEILDNGAMTRPVERLADSERLHAERKAGADELAGMSLKPAND